MLPTTVATQTKITTLAHVVSLAVASITFFRSFFLLFFAIIVFPNFSIGENYCDNNFSKMAQHRERTFIMIKPDGVQRGLVGKIISRFEEKGFKLVAMKFMQASEDLLQKHYSDLSSLPFFPGLVKFMQLGPVVPMVWEGLNIVKTGRDIIGATNPMNSQPGTLRGDLCVQTGRNIIHGSDSVPSADKEIALWFKEEELTNYTHALESWVYEDN